MKEGCDCGCNDPVATDPIGMLRFLSDRFKYAGVDHAVGRTYARDIDKILADHQPKPFEGLSERQRKLLGFALWRFASDAHFNANYEAQRGTASNVRRFQQDELDAIELRRMLEGR